MGQPVRSVADYLSALLQEQIDAWRDELTKTTSAQAKANREAGSKLKDSGSGGHEQSTKNDASAVPPEEPDRN